MAYTSHCLRGAYFFVILVYTRFHEEANVRMDGAVACVIQEVEGRAIQQERHYLL